MGKPQGCNHRPASECLAKPGSCLAPKLRAEKRRRVNDPAEEAVPGPDEALSTFDEGDGARDVFDMNASYQSSC